MGEEEELGSSWILIFPPAVVVVAWMHCYHQT